MKLKDIVKRATDKEKFLTISDYTDFCLMYLEFIKTELQAVIVSRNETYYRFFQYKQDGIYNVTRPINSNLMLSLEDFESCQEAFKNILGNIKSKETKQEANRKLLNDYVYTCQQSISAALDALPANRSNTARKINGDIAFTMSYQHDLIIKVDDVTKAIGSVKTSSKDRVNKIFIDKFLYNKLTDTKTPHFAIFLNDVQRKGKEGKYGINATFLPGHFKGYTIKLNPLDGVYYFDIRPNMTSEEILKDQIKTFDNFLIHDVWKFHEQSK